MERSTSFIAREHTGVAISATPEGRAHSTVVSTAVLDGKLGFRVAAAHREV
jgi:hypothetical protein